MGWILYYGTICVLGIVAVIRHFKTKIKYGTTNGSKVAFRKHSKSS
jgi:hypothetical protein